MSIHCGLIRDDHSPFPSKQILHLFVPSLPVAVNNMGCFICPLLCYVLISYGIIFFVTSLFPMASSSLLPPYFLWHPLLCYVLISYGILFFVTSLSPMASSSLLHPYLLWHPLLCYVLISYGILFFVTSLSPMVSSSLINISYLFVLIPSTMSVWVDYSVHAWAGILLNPYFHTQVIFFIIVSVACMPASMLNASLDIIDGTIYFYYIISGVPWPSPLLSFHIPPLYYVLISSICLSILVQIYSLSVGFF